MCKSKRVLWVWTLSPVLVLAMAMGLTADPPDASSLEAARMATYDKADGETFFALSLAPKVRASSTEARDIVVVFDTSASQTGVYRDDALAALRQMLDSLGDEDRVKLVAADLRAVPLSKEFVGPRSPEMKEALGKLERRVPLGSTDMRAVLEQSAGQFAGAPGNAKALVYIGDGMSKANLLSGKDFSPLLDRLVENQIPVSAFAIGPRRDVQLLATLANQTGGNWIVDAEGVSAQQAGDGLAQIAEADVIWPGEVTLPTEMTEVYPKRVPPLRSDRDSILVGKLSGRGPQDIQMTATLAGKPVDLSWTASPEKSNEDHAYLPQLVDLAAKDDGATLPTAGSAGLREARRVLNAAAGGLANLSGRALASGDTEGARRLADAALARDPGDPMAAAVRDAAAGGGGAGGGEAPLRVGGGGDGSLLADVEAEMGLGDFLNEVENQQQIQTEILQAEVEEGLSTARDNFDTHPHKAQQDLKLLLETIERAPDVEAETRALLRDQVISAIQEARRRQIENDEKNQLRLASEASAKERQRIIEQLSRREEAIKTIMDRFNALMDERRFREAEEAAQSVKQILPDTVIAKVAVQHARFEGFWRDIMELNNVRQKLWVDTMYQIERSAVPFPDDPPITYPDPQVWEGLTLRRKKFASIDLAKQGGAEEKILMALEDTTTLEFIETPLQDVVDYLKDLHSIEIQVDARALEDVGIGSDTPITRNLNGITLRSALRLMLKELDLTYVIRDEVLLITTPEEAESQLITKVYPVADLVLPISAGAGANPFQMGGGLGGGGGFGGGMGGGGMGGGGMGGGMMGGGGGFGGGMGGMGGGMGGGMFNMDDALSLGGKKSAENASPAPAATRSTTTRPAKQTGIKLERKSGESAMNAWDRYFAEHDAPTAAVRQTIRDLIRAKKFDETIAAVQGALRHGQAQPWMYESLGLAIQAKCMLDKELDMQDELERALMSAVDFSNTPEDVMLVAIYMTRVGLDKRALSLFQDVAEAAPTRAEPYLLGLKTAERLDDVDGIQWACLGVLRQAWPNNQRAVEDKARRMAQATVYRLRKEGRVDEAKVFEQALNRTMARDVRVVVTWTGDADIDVLVEEPSGTICSMRYPRTTSGGVMLGDTASRQDIATAAGFSEEYVCPEAFSGNYRMLIRRVWGKVTAGKVTVEVYTNYKNKGEKLVKRQIELGEKDAIVLFDLDSGRRQEPLEEHQIASSAQTQLAVSRAVVAQKLNARANSKAARDFELAMRHTGPGVTGSRGRRGVGYRPVITTLPEGTNMTATAVISADRRYVRITAIPLFSLIGEVTTFNFSTGTNDPNDPNAVP